MVTCTVCRRLLRPTRARQYEALWAVVSAILWKVGEQQRVVVAVPQEKSHVPHSQTYFQDGVTEKVRRAPHRVVARNFFAVVTVCSKARLSYSCHRQLHLFEFTTLQDLQIFMKQYLYLVRVSPADALCLFGSVCRLTLPNTCSQYTDDPGPGCLLLLYGAVLTRGCDK